MPPRRLLAVPLLAIAGVAHAQPPPLPTGLEPKKDVEPRNWTNFRVGASSDTETMQMCLEIAPVRFLAIEGCGNGSGFLHSEPEPEIAHFRAKAAIVSVHAGDFWIAPLVGFGIAELQIDEDTGGFTFNGTDRGVSTAGAEAMAGLRAVAPGSSGWEFVAELSFTMAYLPYAPDLIDPHDVWQPSASFTIGVGY
jgi:hypothetical protein